MKHVNDVKEIVWIETDKIHPNEWNPFEQTDDTFNSLVENIRENGFVDPCGVAPHPDKPGEYKIVDGEHRWQAGRVLKYEKVPCIVHGEWNEDMQKFQTMRFNMIKGKLNPLKFGNLYNELARKYGDEVTRKLMAFTDRKEFEKVLDRTMQNVPPDIKKKLKDSKKEIDNVQTLSAVLNNLFKKYGDTVKHGFMVFTFGGKTHTWVMMNEKVRDEMESLKDACVDYDLSLNTIFEVMFEEMNWNLIVDKAKERSKTKNEETEEYHSGTPDQESTQINDKIKEEANG